MLRFDLRKTLKLGDRFVNLSLWCLIIIICVVSLAVIIVVINNNNIYGSIERLTAEYMRNGKLMDEVKDYNYVLERYKSDSKKIGNTPDNVELELIEYTSNAVFNSVISYEKHKAERMGINVRINSSTNKTICWKMRDTDTVAVLANIFDNAIEGACKSTGRYINIDITDDIMTRLIMINSKDEKLEFDEDIIQTSKNNEREHGFGISVIKEIIDRYKGNVRIADFDNEFQVCVEVPR